MDMLPLGVPTKGQVFTLRSYQEEAVCKGVEFFERKSGPNEIIMAPTGSGKSLIVSNICERFNERILVLQPSQEILRQNYAKFVASGGHAGIYSASVGRKDMARVTFASIQTVMSRGRGGNYLNADLFKGYRNIIIDECHLGSDASGEGQLITLLDTIKEATKNSPRVLGLTATPFRTYSCTNRDGQRDTVLKMLTRTRPRIFGHISYWTQVKELLEQGFLATPRYFDVRKELSHGFDRSVLKVNSTGADYDEKALQKYYDTIDFKQDIVKIVSRINKTGKQVLVFMSSVSDAEWVSNELGNSATVTGKTPAAERKQIEADFKAGKLRSVANCGVWTTGFDYPELKVVLLARPLRSLSLYYQMLGRALRPFEGKDAWLVDSCGNFPVFGRIEDLTLDHDEKNLPVLKGSNGKLLTGVPLREQEVHIADGDMKVMVAKKPAKQPPLVVPSSRGGFNEMMQKARAHAGVVI
jgi:DNA repair protein RadD